MKKINVIMIGVRSHYAIPLIMYRLNILNKFITDFNFNKRIINNLLPRNIISKLERRRVPAELNNNVMAINIIGFIYAIIIRMVRKNDGLSDVVHYFYGRLATKIFKFLLPKNSIIYAYEGVTIKKNGDYLFLEQTIAPYKTQREIIVEEYKKWPKLKKITFMKKIGWWLHTKREINDWSMANIIISPSDFVKKSLINCGVEDNKIEIIEYGVDLKKIPNPLIRYRNKNDKLKIIFVGDLSVRKGALCLLECAKILNEENTEFDICGSIDLPEYILSEYKNHVKLNGRLNFKELIEKLNKAHLFFFPSLVEGSAMSIVEATCSGLPVICTKSSGSRIRDGIDGLIMKDNSVESAIECINTYLKNEELISIHSKNAIQQRNNLSLEAYQDKIKKLLEKQCK